MKTDEDRAWLEKRALTNRGCSHCDQSLLVTELLEALQQARAEEREHVAKELLETGEREARPWAEFVRGLK